MREKYSNGDYFTFNIDSNKVLEVVTIVSLFSRSMPIVKAIILAPLFHILALSSRWSAQHPVIPLLSLKSYEEEQQS